MSRSLLRQIIKNDIIQYGDFTLKSGEKSNIYANFKDLYSYPKLFAKTVREMCTMIKSTLSLSDDDFTNANTNTNTNINTKLHIIGVPFGAIPLATAIATQLNASLLLLRPEQKEYGTKKQIEGNYKKDDNIILIEDVITTGGSVNEAIQIITNHDLNISGVFSIFDRSKKNGNDTNERENLHLNIMTPYNFLINMNNLQTIVHQKDNLIRLVNRKKTNIIFSCDLTSMEDILEYAKLLGPYICMIKIHSDIIKDFTLDGITILYCLGIEYDFFIMEDRKFGDLADTLKKQINGNQQYTQWCDYVTAYPYIGESGLEVFKENNIGVFLISELSFSNEPLPYKELYSAGVVGTIGQNNTGSLQATPGIHLTAKKDKGNQKYRTPEEALETGVDLFIIGRGIYDAEDPLETIKEYQKRCFTELNNKNN